MNILCSARVNAAPSEISACACDTTQERLDVAGLFNKVGKSFGKKKRKFVHKQCVRYIPLLQMSIKVKENVPDSGEAYASSKLREKLAPLKDMSEEIKNILTDSSSQAMDIEPNPQSESKNVGAAEAESFDHIELEVEEEKANAVIVEED